MTKKFTIQSVKGLQNSEYLLFEFFMALRIATVYQQTERLDMGENLIDEFVRENKITCKFASEPPQRQQHDEGGQVEIDSPVTLLNLVK